MCARHDRARPSRDRGAEGRELGLQQRLARRGHRRQADMRVDLGGAVPGEVLRTRSHPGRLQAFDECGDVTGDEPGSRPNERTPITGLSGFVLTSATGARSCVDPDRPELVAERTGDRCRQPDVVDRAEREVPGHRAAAEPLRAASRRRPPRRSRRPSRASCGSPRAARRAARRRARCARRGRRRRGRRRARAEATPAP